MAYIKNRALEVGITRLLALVNARAFFCLHLLSFVLEKVGAQLAAVYARIPTAATADAPGGLENEERK